MKDLSFCRQQFPSLQRTGEDGKPLVFLDGPGGSQVPYPVINAISEYYRHHNANTHGHFITSRESDRIVDKARLDVKALLGASETSSVSFGQNMTTLNFMLSQALGSYFRSGDEIIVTDLDHDSNISPWLRLAERGIVVRHAPITDEATLDLDAFKKLLSKKTRLVAIGWASNAVGTVNPLATIREWTRQVGSLMLVDAVHWAPHGPIDVADLQPDFLLCSAYKFFGPHIGILYAAPSLLDKIPTLRVRPQLSTGPEKIETGTLNHAALAGVSAAINFIAALETDRHQTYTDQIHHAMAAVYSYEHHLAGLLYEGLLHMPHTTLYGPPVTQSQRTPTVSFTIDGAQSSHVAQELAKKGILVWDGDFYAMTLIDRLGIREQGGLVRLGLAPYTTTDEIYRTLDAIREVEVTLHG